MGTTGVRHRRAWTHVIAVARSDAYRRCGRTRYGPGGAALTAGARLRIVASVVRHRSDPWRGALVVALHLGAVLVVGAADYLSGPDYELRPFYLFPVISAAWYGGWRLGLVISFAATVSLFLANDYLGTVLARGLVVPFWNTMSRVTIYGVVTVLTSQLRRQADRLRGQSEELRRGAASREEYIALFVHELRHSAAAMALASASLETSPRLAEDERSFVGRLRQQAIDLEQLAGQLLTIGPLEGGALALNLHPVDLSELARATVAGSTAPDRVDVEIPGHAVLVRADPEELRRAADNLLRNALIYSPAPSRVTVAVLERDERAGIEVRDRGIGFARADAGRLFQKYGRLASTARSGKGGAGLGLYLTRLIVEAHGGAVEAASPGPGGGARFAFLLPRSAPGA